MCMRATAVSTAVRRPTSSAALIRSGRGHGRQSTSRHHQNYTILLQHRRRPTSVLDHDGNGYTFEYIYNDDQEQYYLQKTDTNGKITEYWFDEETYKTIRVDVNGRTVKTIDKDERTYTLTYDADGNMDTLTDPEGNITRFTYDVMGNVLTKTDARDKVWTYTYDNTGRLRTITDPLRPAHRVRL